MLRLSTNENGICTLTSVYRQQAKVVLLSEPHIRRAAALARDYIGTYNSEAVADANTLDFLAKLISSKDEADRSRSEAALDLLSVVRGE